MTATTESTAPTPTEKLRRWWPGWRDAVCLVLLATVAFHLACNDGGRPLAPVLPVLVLSALGQPVAPRNVKPSGPASSPP